MINLRYCDKCKLLEKCFIWESAYDSDRKNVPYRNEKHWHGWRGKPPIWCPSLLSHLKITKNFSRKRIRGLRRHRDVSNAKLICKRCYEDHGIEWTYSLNKMWRKHRHLFCIVADGKEWGLNECVFSGFSPPPDCCLYKFEHVICKER